MSFVVTFYSFSKKLNSTKRPDNTVTSVTYNCDIKDSSSVLNPVLLVSYDFNSKIEGLYNYCYIPIWNRYYFIRNYSYASGLWEISLNVDVLATWKPYIGNTRAFIARSASKVSTEFIDDKVIPTWYADIASSYNTSNFFGGGEKGTYVLGVKGPSDDSTSGAITYYALTQTGMNKLLNTLCDSAFAEYQDIAVEILKSQYDPYNYIASCRWYPYTVASSKQVTAIKLGWYTVTVPSGQCGIAVADQFFFTNTLRIPKHSQENIVGKFLNSTKFFTINMYLPGYGVYELNPDVVAQTEFLEVHLTVDHATGQGIYTLDLHDDLIINSPIAILNCNIGVDIPITTMQLNAPYLNPSSSLGGIITKTLGMIGEVVFPSSEIKKGFYASDELRSGGWTIPTFITTIANGSNLSVNSVGSTGNRAAYEVGPNGGAEIAIWGVSSLVRAPNYDDVGYPYFKEDLISNHNGYLSVINPHITAPATNEELVNINNFVEGGFFYE